MTYNKSEIMTRAWSLFRTGHYYNFAGTLEQAWREAKRVAEQRKDGYVQADELNAGDSIAVNGYGGYEGNDFTKQITSIKACGWDDKSIIISFILNGVESNICVEKSEMIKRTAQAVVEMKAAA